MVDVRVEKPQEWSWVERLGFNTYIQLTRIDLHPPASGPEIELTFNGDLEGDCAKLCREAGLHVLASRPR